MLPVTVKEIALATGAIMSTGQGEEKILDVVTDSRQVKAGDLFVARKGERVDGHNFISAAFAKGAVAALVENDQMPQGNGIILKVENTEQALLHLAAWYRRKFGTTVVGVTGSTGKTSTKEMIAAVLTQEFNVHKSVGNYNTEVGVSLTLLQLEPKHEIAVIEMGMRGLGQIRQLAQVALPKIGVITNIDVTHLEILGTIENIARAKGELLAEIPPDGVAILNGDDQRQQELAQNFAGKVIFYGFGEDNHFRAINIQPQKGVGTEFTVCTPEDKLEIKLNLPGKHNVRNALAAIAVGSCFGLKLSSMAQGLAEFKPVAMRLDTIKTEDGVTIINDAYNANPTTMDIALTTLMDLKEKGRAIAVLGDMLELGPIAQSAHRELGYKAAGLGVDLLVVLGTWREEVLAGARAGGLKQEQCRAFASREEAVAFLDQYVTPGDVVLVKASRGLSLEYVVSQLASR
ncbi:MAG: UDP-N-acetylmuramoyl-tripeptide--D-alanyl-D-alanine ligase [bacterium]